MATTAETQISINSSGDGIDSDWEPRAMTNNAAAAGGPVRTPLAAGDNYVLVPTGVMGFVLLPPATSAVVKRLKHHAGETGFAIRSAEAVALSLPTGVATMMIHASAEELVYLHWT